MEALRHELKFVVDLDEGEAFLREISQFCEADPHAGPDASYEIASLYYDTPDLRFFYDREESVANRRKVRLRTYRGSSSPPILLLEIKEKHGHLIGKKKCVVSDSELLLPGIDHAFLDFEAVLKSAAESEARGETEYLNARLGLRPVSIIRYIRKAYFSRDCGVRITLDKRLTAGGVSMSRYDDSREQLILPSGKAILEVKTERQVPLWVVSAMLRYGFRRERFSKYCAAVHNVGVLDSNSGDSHRLSELGMTGNSSGICESVVK